jgi:glycosyltransferase involved in cell wall biosynthesis
MIAHFSAKLNGGGHIAARRLHDALRRSGLESRFYYGTGETSDATYFPLFQNQTFFWRNMAALSLRWQSRRQSIDGYVLSPRWIRKTPLLNTGKTPGIINLHEVARWLDLPSFFQSLPHGLPVVWSLHTLLPISGGCIYTGDCDGFTRQCGNCPQLKRPGPGDDTNKFLRIKEHWFQKLNLHLVGNSAWTTAQIERSSLAKYAKSVRTIHYGLNVEQFKPVNKKVAREALGMSEDKFVIGFACSAFDERRKGAHLLIEALKALPSKDIILAVFGGGLWPQGATECETITLGSIASPRLQSVFYSAIDVFAMPTEIETFGLVAAEAMACETPVVAYPGGGLADVVTDGETGLIEPEIGSVPGLVRMLNWMRQHPTERRAMGIAARRSVVEKFSDSLMASHYAKLYQELKNG